ncbi:MAG: pilus assembly protein N-terminal domain-containing protein [Candidatus Omnitrophica bacterium]|nr:pilus assembly protein N-terminal domain-containing protein [Candidatus Omnitrophota bacterium]
MRKPIIILLIVGFLFLSLAPLYAGQMCDYLCAIGMNFFRQGRYEEALGEFKKVLLVEPNYQPALKYIEMTEQALGQPQPEEEPEVEAIQQSSLRVPKGQSLPAGQTGNHDLEIASAAARPRNDSYQATPETNLPPARIVIPKAKAFAQNKTKEMTLKEILDLAEIQKEMIDYEKAMRKRRLTAPVGFGSTSRTAAAKTNVPRIIILSETANALPQQIEIEQGKEIVILGKNISRYLITEPTVASAEKRSADELDIIGKTIGYTDVIIWDDNGRWTQQFLGIFPKPETPLYEELARKEAEQERNFKLRYSVDWLSYETGKSIHEWRRSSYSWTHGLNILGPTPYGDFDATTSIRSENSSSRADMNYLTVGLTNGQYGNFKGFNIRGFDISPPFSDLAFSGATLRGGMFNTPAFDKKLEYTAFWGREGGGRYGGLSPSLTKTLNSFVEGFNAALSPDKVQTYKFTVAHGWGRDRTNYLHPYDYDMSGRWNFNKWGMGYEIANDTQTFAHIVDAHYNADKMTNTVQFRDIDKRFMSITNTGWRQGEIGGLVTSSYQPTETLGMRTSLDVYKDRLYPAPENPERLNEDLDWNASYRLDPLTSLGLNYSFRNDLGEISQSRSQSAGLNGSRKIHFIKDISTYANYSNQSFMNFSSHTSDYINDRLNLGLRFSIIGQFYYYYNWELNWLQERSYGTWAHPKAMETGVEWSDQIGKTSPFFGSFRLTYRQEKDTESHLSFLSGEDYLEGYSELSYRPNNEVELYGSSRVRNVWAGNPNVTKRIEGTFNAGMRYLWDTGFRFEAKGDIEGYVFKDLNGDGLRQRDEPPVEGIKIWLGRDKSCITDLFGYYKFKGVKGRNAYINLDTSTIPQGFVLTIPASQEVAIVHKRAVKVDFGIASRTEINGIVFEDVDENGEYNKGDKGVGGILLSLESGQKTKTDTLGRYSFNNVSVGTHTITLDLNTIPVYYLPEQALSENVSISEGAVITHHIPLRRIKE